MKANTKKRNKIFRLKHGVIEVYNYEPIITKIVLYKQEQMKKIPEDDQVLKREYNDAWLIKKPAVVYECESFVIRKDPPKTFDDREENYFFVRKYIEGLLGNASAHSRKDVEGNDLFYISPKDGTPYKRIQIPKELYIEYLLENERFTAKALQKESLKDQKELFKISSVPKMEFYLDDLESLLDSGLVRGDFDSKLELLEGSTKVYEKMK